MHFLKSHRSTLLTLFSVLAAAFAAPYLVPGDPDAQVFRNGVLPALLLLAAAYPVHAAFEKHPARALKYGLFLGLVFTFFLGVGSELMFYDQLLPGMGSLIRRFSARRRAVFPSVRPAPARAWRFQAPAPLSVLFSGFCLVLRRNAARLLPRHHQL